MSAAFDAVVVDAGIASGDEAEIYVARRQCARRGTAGGSSCLS